MTTTEHDTDASLAGVTNGIGVARVVVASGRIQEISWRTRTALLYDGEGVVTALRFTPEQDGWLRLVANIPVDLQGVAHLDDDGEVKYVELEVVSVKERGWEPHDSFDYLDVAFDRLHDPGMPEPLDWWDSDSFMASIRDMREGKL